MTVPHKGFEIVLHAEGPPRRYRYEIRHRGRVLVTSPVAYGREADALREAQAFVDGVDRLLGLDAPARSV